jgi:hypothetical protein
MILESGGKGWWFYNFSTGLKRKLKDFKGSLMPINEPIEKNENRIAPLLNTDSTEINTGDYVRVRSKEELLALMEQKEYKCPIMSEMYEGCEKIYRVIRKVDHFYDEVKQKMCKCKDIFLLEGSTCSGQMGSFPEPCDLDCFFFWHKDWLEKA